MRSITFLLALLLVSAPAISQQKNAALHQLFEQEWQRGLSDYPENASYSGDTRYNDRWTDMSLAAIGAREAADRAALAKLQGIGRAALSPSDQLNYDTFEWQLTRNIERQRYREYLMPMTHQGGVQTADGIAELLDFRTEKAYSDWLARLDKLPALIDQNIVLLREGVKTGRTPPKAIMQRVPNQINAQVVKDPESSAFYAPFKKLPGSIPAQRQAELRAQARRIIAERVVPAYARLGTYFNTDYLAATRDVIRATTLPDGIAYYDFLAPY